MTDEQPQLIKPTNVERLIVDDGFDLLWRHHFAGRPCARTYEANWYAMSKSFGTKQLDELNEIDITRHVETRRSGMLTGIPAGDQTIAHDLMLLTIMYNRLRKWKRKKFSVDGLDMRKANVPLENPNADIPKPKGKPRTRIVTPMEFAIFTDQAPPNLTMRCTFALHLAMSEIDLRLLRPEQYNPHTDSVEFRRHKTGKNQIVPASKYVKAEMIRAMVEKRQFVLDWTNHINEWRLTWKKCTNIHPRFQFRDIRKSTLNAAIEYRMDIRDGQRIGGHATARTTVEHYWVSKGKDLKEVIRHVERRYANWMQK
jgi:hypothetical protein